MHYSTTTTGLYLIVNSQNWCTALFLRRHWRNSRSCWTCYPRERRGAGIWVSSPPYCACVHVSVCATRVHVCNWYMIERVTLITISVRELKHMRLRITCFHSDRWVQKTKEFTYTYMYCYNKTTTFKNKGEQDFKRVGHAYNYEQQTIIIIVHTINCKDFSDFY